MRTIRASVFLAIAIMIVPVPSSALEIPTQEGSPFSFFTWPFQVIVTVAQAPIELASGGIKTINTLLLPSDKQWTFGASKATAAKQAETATEKAPPVNPAQPVAINMPSAAAESAVTSPANPTPAPSKPSAGAVPASAKTEPAAGS